ncbi:MAG: hypothetical protein BWY95_02109 [Bacteroidetes bacterium ADurb.BinA104]|nr:MAG: hypothetical protein BWY95_02109 [Bacteroidetes bacterium ADurb.BinA104]
MVCSDPDPKFRFGIARENCTKDLSAWICCVEETIVSDHGRDTEGLDCEVDVAVAIGVVKSDSTNWQEALFFTTDVTGGLTTRAVNIVYCCLLEYRFWFSIGWETWFIGSTSGWYVTSVTRVWKCRGESVCVPIIHIVKW